MIRIQYKNISGINLLTIFFCIFQYLAFYLMLVMMIFFWYLSVFNIFSDVNNNVIFLVFFSIYHFFLMLVMMLFFGYFSVFNVFSDV